MSAIAFYLLKVSICSGIFFLYYLIALKNRQFHQWNRFYLMVSTVASLVIPLIAFTVTHKETPGEVNPIQLLQVVESGNSYLEEVVAGKKGNDVNFDWMLMAYLAVSIVLFIGLIQSVVKIARLIRSHKSQAIDGIRFFNTTEKGTPFSFLNSIFWNKEIDIQSPTGQQIFEHEVVHVKEKHTLDKLFMQFVIIIFWCNPFFWLIRKELKMIHEFIADQKAVDGHGAEALAKMILQVAYPSQFNSISNPFFQTSIKRRLVMLTKIQNPRLNYFTRMLALPVMAVTVLAFTIKTKTEHQPVKIDKPFTVVIDAGHGKTETGGRSGATASDVYEDDIVLSIAQKVAALNNNENLKVVLTRNAPSVIDLKERVSIAKENKADLFISIHVSADPSSNASSGIEVLVSNKNTSFQKESERFGSILQKQLNDVYSTKSYLQKRQAGVFVLDQNICPSVLVECGYITNQRDREFINKTNNQETVARKIITAIESYASLSGSSK